MQTQQFRRRILLVDSDRRFLKACAHTLRRKGYEVLIAEDGFAALVVLRGARPDMLITELTLPRMSGFELLSIVRTRFPNIAVIAMSDEYTPLTMPHEAVCDAFLAKGPNLNFELTEEVEQLISQSPIRASRAKSEVAPVWIPHSNTGYIVLTCPECLRSFSALEPKAGAAIETCICCGASVPFEMSSVAALPVPHAQSSLSRARKARAKSRELRMLGQDLRKQI